MVFGADWDEPLPPQEGYAYTLDQLRTYAGARAVADWNLAERYEFGDVVCAPDGRYFQAVTPHEPGSAAPADGVDGWRRLVTA